VFAYDAGEFERLHDEALLECLSAGLTPNVAIDRDVVEQIRSDFSADAAAGVMQASDSLGLEFKNWMAVASSARRVQVLGRQLSGNLIASRM
jgi:hypothetical protein